MSGGPLAVIPSGLATRPRTSLLTSGVPVIEGEQSRWENGVTFTPDACGTGGIVDPCVTSAKAPDALPAAVEFEPFGVWTGVTCSTFGFQARDYQGQARRQLAAFQSRYIEREFWRGDQARTSAWPNRYLTHLDNDVLTAGATTPRQALACLEQALFECGFGQRGVIHATPQVVTEWAAENLVRREGGIILTVLDTIVVAGSGYDGSGPQVAAGGAPVAAADGSVWAYATGMVEVRLSDVEVLTPSLREATDRSANTVTVIAERLAAVTFDQCCHFAAEMDLTVCDVGGAGS